MSPVRKLHYKIHIWTRNRSHFLGYSPTTRGFYITAHEDSAQEFLDIKDAVNSFFEFCETHRTIAEQPEYEIFGYNVNRGNI